MSHVSSARRAILALGLTALVAACGSSEPTADSPHLILLSIDTLGADAIRPWNPDAPRRPHLEALAAEAATFEDALAPAGWTLPSHASLMTGLYPHHHGAAHPDHRLPDHLVTLAEVLQEAGWATAAFTDQGYVAHQYGFDQGFQRYDETCSAGWSDPACRATAPRPVADAGPSEIFSRARSFLEGQPADQPLFLFLHTYWAHNYFLFDETLETATGTTLDGERAGRCMTDVGACSTEEWALMRELYDRRIDELDQALGVLRQAVEDHLPDRPTYFVLLSDHGEGFDPTMGRIHHAGRLHGDQLRVPLLVAGSDLTPGPRTQAVSLVDVAPTLLDLAGLDSEASGRPGRGPDGRSLVPLLKTADTPRRPRRRLAFEHAYEWRNGQRIGTGDGSFPLKVAVMARRYWYISDGETPTLYGPGDRRHRDDLLTESPPVPMANAMDRTAENLLTFRSSSSAVTADRELEEQLEALGYIN